MIRFLKNAPKILVDLYNDPDDSFYQDELLKKLLTSDVYMKEVWKALDRRIGGDVMLFVIFVIEVQQAALGPNKWESMTLKQREDWVDKTTNKCNDLASALGNVYSDLTTSECLDVRLDQDDELPIYKLLFNISRKINSIPIDNLQFSERPNTKQAKILYFVRRLSQYIEDEFNEHLYEVITNTASVIFDKETITKDYVVGVLKKTK